MRVLLVEPAIHRTSLGKIGRLQKTSANSNHTVKRAVNDDSLWYPPLGLMKFARFHKDRGDEVHFASGCDRSLVTQSDLFSPSALWDRVYITTLFTYNYDTIIKTINFYKEAVGGTASKVFVGGIMSSIMSDAIIENTGICPIPGIVTSPKQIGLDGEEKIDLLPPDYEVLSPRQYAINDTYYTYTSRGCVNSCPWCGVPKIEPVYIPYIDIKPIIKELRRQYGDMAKLKLMDNNVLASNKLERIVQDLLELGYGRDSYTNSQPKKQRVVDFNQGLDASYLTEDRMELLSKLNIKPMRIAFDRAKERKVYVRALELARKYGVREFSNYMLYNWRDTPRDLYDRLVVNMELNEMWNSGTAGNRRAQIYSYPMRYAPIDETNGTGANRRRDSIVNSGLSGRDWLDDAVWTKRFVRNIEIIKGATHGAISPSPGLARRAMGASYEEFIANLYMPEELLRNRNRHECRVYAEEPSRKPGSGLVEEFRAFMLKLIKSKSEEFYQYHEAVSENTAESIRRYMKTSSNKEIRKWLKYYLKRK